MKEELSSPKHRFLQEPYGVTSKKTTFFIVTAVKTSNLVHDFIALTTCLKIISSLDDISTLKMEAKILPKEL
jgi:hypothetical protein